jgi:mRNA guanylyltransferase
MDTLPFHKILDPDCLTAMTSMTRTNGFPGSLCVSIERKDIPTVRNKPYWVCEKSDGARFLLVVMKFKGTNLVALVGRRTDDVYAIKVQKVPRDLYKGTILDGEMVQDKQTNRWTFLAFDALFVAGRDVRERAFSERYLDICAAMTHYEPHERDSIAFKIKAFFPVANLAQCMDPKRDPVRERFGWDGLVFTPDAQRVVAGRNFDMFKWKPVHSITVDFCVQHDGLTLLANDRQTLVPVGRLDAPGVPGSIVECQLLNAHEAVWHVYRVRSDKTYPNDMLTFTRTLANIQEGIALEDFYDRK